MTANTNYTMPSKRRRNHKSKNRNKLKSNKVKVEVKRSPLEQEIINLHAKFVGFKNPQDWQKCVDIHLTLTQCSLITAEFDHNILKEIATMANGQALDCVVCKSPFCVLYGNTVDDDGLWQQIMT